MAESLLGVYSTATASSDGGTTPDTSMSSPTVQQYGNALFLVFLSQAALAAFCEAERTASTDLNKPGLAVRFLNCF